MALKRIFLVLAIFGLVISGSSNCYAIIWSGNLLGNPGAEDGVLSPWTVVGPMYVTTSQAQSSGTVYPHSGDYFFSGAGAPAAIADLMQNVDVSAYAAMID
ncbi:hypothetical protein ACFL2I_05685, partial [Candidatus Omnitrophota bacterium]